MNRFFNVSGPCREGEHYMLPPLDRLSPTVRNLVDRKSYFVLRLGWLMIFDRRPGQAPLYTRCSAERLSSSAGNEVVVVRA